MTMRLAVTDALLAALRAAHGPAVWVLAPENAAPPYTIIDQIVGEPLGSKASRAEWLTVEVADWTIGASRVELEQRMETTRGALDGVLLTGAGVAPFRPLLQPGATDELGADDGLTWRGSQRFRLLAQPA